MGWHKARDLFSRDEAAHEELLDMTKKLYRIISDASLFKPLQSAAGRLNKQRQFLLDHESDLATQMQRAGLFQVKADPEEKKPEDKGEGEGSEEKKKDSVEKPKSEDKDVGQDSKEKKKDSVEQEDVSMNGEWDPYVRVA